MTSRLEELRRVRRNVVPPDVALQYVEALDRRDFPTLLDMLETGPVNPQFETVGGDTVLTAAAWWGEDAVIKAVANMGTADLNFVTRRGACALTEAARAGRYDTLELLLTLGADLHKRNELGETVLHQLFAEVTPTMTDEELAPTLDMMRHLVHLGADVNATTVYGNPPLLVACYGSMAKAVEFLASVGADTNVVTFNATPLMAALSVKAYDIAENLLARGANINAQTTGAQTPLTRAACDGEADVVDFLIKHGADVNHKTTNDCTALQFAAHHNRPEAVRHLLEAGAEPDIENSSHATPLIAACRHNAADCVTLLLEAGVDMNRQAGSGLTPLMEATQFSAMDAIEALVRARVDPSVVSTAFQTTALIQAVQLKKFSVVQLLVNRAHASVTQTVGGDGEEGGDSAITAGVQAGHVSMLRFLLNQNGVLEYLVANRAMLTKLATDMGDSAIMELIENGLLEWDREQAALAIHKSIMRGVHEQLFRHVMERIAAEGWGHGLALGSDFLAPIFEEVIEEGRFKSVEHILDFAEAEREWVVERRLAIHTTAEARSAAEYEEEQRQLRLAALAGLSFQGTGGPAPATPDSLITPNYETGGGYTPIMRAAGKGDIVMVERLLRMGANPNHENRDGSNTPLTWACINNQLEAVRVLIKARATVNHETSKGVFALTEACFWGHPRIVRALIIAGADVNYITRHGRVPLHEAIERNDVACVKLLLQAGADVNLEAKHTTPLMIAAKVANMKVVQLLVKFRVDTKHMNEFGHNALHEARKYGRDDIKDLLIGCNGLGFVEKAIREWEHGYLLRALRKWMEVTGVTAPEKVTRGGDTSLSATLAAGEEDEDLIGPHAVRRSSIVGLAPPARKRGAQLTKREARHDELIATTRRDIKQAQSLTAFLTPETRDAMEAKAPPLFVGEDVAAALRAHLKRYVDHLHRAVEARVRDLALHGDEEDDEEEDDADGGVGAVAAVGVGRRASVAAASDEEDEDEEAFASHIFVGKASLFPPSAPELESTPVCAFSTFVHRSLLQAHGSDEVFVQKVLAALVHNVAQYREAIPHVRLFSLMAGLHNPPDVDSYNGMAVTASLFAIRYLSEAKLLFLSDTVLAPEAPAKSGAGSSASSVAGPPADGSTESGDLTAVAEGDEEGEGKGTEDTGGAAQLTGEAIAMLTEEDKAIMARAAAKKKQAEEKAKKFKLMRGKSQMFRKNIGQQKAAEEDKSDSAVNIALVAARAAAARGDEGEIHNLVVMSEEERTRLRALKVFEQEQKMLMDATREAHGFAYEEVCDTLEHVFGTKDVKRAPPAVLALLELFKTLTVESMTTKSPISGKPKLKKAVAKYKKARTKMLKNRKAALLAAMLSGGDAGSVSGPAGRRGRRASNVGGGHKHKPKARRARRGSRSAGGTTDAALAAEGAAAKAEDTFDLVSLCNLIMRVWAELEEFRFGGDDADSDGGMGDGDEDDDGEAEGGSAAGDGGDMSATGASGMEGAVVDDDSDLDSDGSRSAASVASAVDVADLGAL